MYNLITFVAISITSIKSKLFAIFLAYQHPVDLLTGQKIDTDNALSWINQKEFHHFFPQAYLKNVGFNTNKINCLANIVFLTSSSNKFISDKSPSQYLLEIENAADTGGNHTDRFCNR